MAEIDKLNALIRESVRTVLEDTKLNEESIAAKIAKAKGLVYAAFGRWKDKTGKVVAKSDGDRLVKPDAPAGGGSTQTSSSSRRGRGSLSGGTGQHPVYTPNGDPNEPLGSDRNPNSDPSVSMPQDKPAHSDAAGGIKQGWHAHDEAKGSWDTLSNALHGIDTKDPASVENHLASLSNDDLGQMYLGSHTAKGQAEHMQTYSGAYIRDKWGQNKHARLAKFGDMHNAYIGELDRRKAVGRGESGEASSNSFFGKKKADVDAVSTTNAADQNDDTNRKNLTSPTPDAGGQYQMGDPLKPAGQDGSTSSRSAKHGNTAPTPSGDNSSAGKDKNVQNVSPPPAPGTQREKSVSKSKFDASETLKSFKQPPTDYNDKDLHNASHVLAYIKKHTSDGGEPDSKSIENDLSKVSDETLARTYHAIRQLSDDASAANDTATNSQSTQKGKLGTFGLTKDGRNLDRNHAYIAGQHMKKEMDVRAQALRDKYGTKKAAAAPEAEIPDAKVKKAPVRKRAAPAAARPAVKKPVAKKPAVKVPVKKAPAKKLTAPIGKKPSTVKPGVTKSTVPRTATPIKKPAVPRAPRPKKPIV